jgi:hypothetical protein
VSNVTVEDLRLTNAGDSAGIHHGLYFTSDTGPVNDVTIRDLEVDHVDSNTSFNTSGGEGGASPAKP